MSLLIPGVSSFLGAAPTPNGARPVGDIYLTEVGVVFDLNGDGYIGNPGFPLSGMGLLPYGSDVVYAGDSITAQGTTTSASGAGQLRNLATGFANWAQYYSLGRLNYGASANKGVSGDTSTQLLARFSAVVALAPKVCVILVGTNDVSAVGDASSAITLAATCISNLQSMITQLRAINCRVILLKVLPRGSVGSPMSANLLDCWNRINAGIASLAARDVTVLDIEPYIGNMDVNHTIQTGLTADNLHPNQRCAELIGRQVGAAINLAVLSGAFFPANNNDPTDLIPNSQLAGGPVPTGWSASVNGGATLTSSKVARSGLPDWYQAALSGTYTGSNRSFTFQQTIDLTSIGVNAGDQWRFAWEIEWDEGSVGLAAIAPQVNIWGGADIIDINAGGSADFFPTGACSGIFVSQPLTMNATGAAAPKKYTIFCFGWLSNTAGTDPVSATIRLGRCRLVKIN